MDPRQPRACCFRFGPTHSLGNRLLLQDVGQDVVQPAIFIELVSLGAGEAAHAFGALLGFFPLELGANLARIRRSLM